MNIGKSIGNFVSKTTSVVGDAVDGAVDTAKDAAKIVKDGAEDLGDIARGRASDKIESFKDTAEDVWETTEKIEDRGREFIGDMIGKGTKAGKRMHDRLEDASRDAIDGAKKGLGEVEDLATKFGRDVVKDTVDTIKDLDAEATKFKRGVKEGITDGVKGLHATAQHASAKIDRAKAQVTDAVIADTKLVLDTVEELKHTSVEEIMDAGWEAAGFSESDRDLLKRAVSEKMSEASGIVSDAFDFAGQDLAQKLEALDDSSLMTLARHSNPAHYITAPLFHHEGLDGVVQDGLDALKPIVASAARAINQNPEISNALADGARGLADVLEFGAEEMTKDRAREFVDASSSAITYIKNHLESMEGPHKQEAMAVARELGGVLEAIGLVEDVLPEVTLSSLPMFDSMQGIGSGVAVNVAVLKALSNVPEGAKFIDENPERFADTVALLKPGHLVTQIENLPVGETYALEMGFGMSGNVEVDQGVKITHKKDGSYEVQLNAMVGTSKEIEVNGVKEGGKISGGREVVFTVSKEGLGDIVKLLQSGMFGDGELGTDLLDHVAITKNHKVISAEGQLKAKAPPLSFGVGVGALLTAGPESLNGKDGFSASISTDASVAISIKDKHLNVSLPDGSPQYNKEVGAMFSAMPEGLGEVLDMLQNTSGTSGSLKCKASVAFDIHCVTEDGNLSCSSSVKGAFDIEPFKFDIQQKITVPDLAGLARAIGTPTDELKAKLESGESNLSQLVIDFGTRITPFIKVERDIKIKVYDKVGVELDTKALKGKAFFTRLRGENFYDTLKRNPERFGSELKSLINEFNGVPSPPVKPMQVMDLGTTFIKL